MWFKELTKEENHTINDVYHACDGVCSNIVFQYERGKFKAHHPTENESAAVRKLFRKSLLDAQNKIDEALKELDANTYAE